MDYYETKIQETKNLTEESQEIVSTRQEELLQDTAKSKKQKKRGIGKFFRIFLIIWGILMIFFGCMAIVDSMSGMQVPKEQETMLIFDPYTASDLKQGVSFKMISYAFASFEFSDAQGLYFVFDKDMYAYIVCMDNDRLETEFADIYEYTFSDAGEAPQEGWLEGYAMEIDGELQNIAIEVFNYLWDEEVVNQDNFEEYFGAYYLDTTYVPGEEGKNPVEDMIAAIFAILIGGFLVYFELIGQKRALRKQEEESLALVAGLGGLFGKEKVKLIIRKLPMK